MSLSADQIEICYKNDDIGRFLNSKAYGFPIRCLADEIEGCTHPNASNYNETANIFDNWLKVMGYDGWATDDVIITGFGYGYSKFMIPQV